MLCDRGSEIVLRREKYIHKKQGQEQNFFMVGHSSRPRSSLSKLWLDFGYAWEGDYPAWALRWWKGHKSYVGKRATFVAAATLPQLRTDNQYSSAVLTVQLCRGSQNLRIFFLFFYFFRDNSKTLLKRLYVCTRKDSTVRRDGETTSFPRISAVMEQHKMAATSTDTSRWATKHEKTTFL